MGYTLMPNKTAKSIIITIIIIIMGYILTPNKTAKPSEEFV